ncbi:hypothetical protein GOV13_03835 [Candidatus Pacearchaeota archaeon]|nr:hypothetical protein [Candidatus Pacearchaeota archaeon]
MKDVEAKVEEGRLVVLNERLYYIIERGNGRISELICENGKCVRGKKHKRSYFLSE